MLQFRNIEVTLLGRKASEQGSSKHGLSTQQFGTDLLHKVLHGIGKQPPHHVALPTA